MDRQAAEWVTKAGGIVQVLVEGKLHEFPKDGPLPAGKLQLTMVDLTGPGEKKELTNEGVRNLASLQHLTALTLRGDQASCGVTDFSFLSSLANLEYLSLHGSGVTDADLVHVKPLSKLKTLNLEHFFGTKTITDTGVEHIKGLTNMKVLWLWGASITDAGIAHLDDMTGLTMLKLGHSQLTDASVTRIAKFKDLTELHLAAMPITDSSVEALKTLTRLQLLNLEQTQVSDQGVEALKAALPTCNVVPAKRNQP